MTNPNIAISSTAKTIAFGENIKMLQGDGFRVGGYLIKFTDENNRDLDGEYFTKRTDLATPHDIEGLPILFHHGLDPRIRDIPIGRLDKGYVDEHGLWVEGILNEREQYEDFVTKWYQGKDAPLSVEDYEKAMVFIKSLIRANKIGWSSGANPNSAKIGADGHIDEWKPFEASGTHTPAEPRLTKLQTLKSILNMFPDTQELKDAFEHKEASESNGDSVDLRGDVKRNSDDIKILKDSLMPEEKEQELDATKSLKMSADEMDEIVKRVMDKIRQSKAEDMDKEDMDKMEEDIKSHLTKSASDMTAFMEKELPDIIAKSVNNAMARKAQFDSALNNAIDTGLGGSFGKSQVGAGSHTEKTTHISVSEDLRYAHLSASDMQFNYMILKSLSPLSKDPHADHKYKMKDFVRSETYAKHMAVKSAKEADEMFKRSPIDGMAMKSASTFKADEINASDITGQGDEWVGVNYSSTLWERARNMRHYQTFRSKGLMEVEVPQGHESTYVLLEDADPTVFTRQQANDLDTNGSTTRVENTVIPQAIGTGRTLLTPGELVTMVAVQQTLTEDSLIPMLPQTNRQLQTTMLEHIDKSMINGDTATGSNTNINLIDGTPSSTITSKPYYLVTNGFLKYALVTGSGTSRDGGTLDENDYRLTYKLMPSAIREDKDNLLFIIDSDTHDASLDIAAIKTDDVRRTNATITSGVMQNIYGIEVLRTGFMPLANSTGKVPSGGGTLGRILCIYPRFFAMGWKRQIRFQYDNDIYSDSYLIAVSMRLGMIPRGAGASTVSYNLTV